MIIWINGCFGVGKTETVNLLHQKIQYSHIYDPEEFGFFLWNIFPEPLKRSGDFQDLQIWREFTYKMLRHMSLHYNGHILVPMTLVNQTYYSEIIGALRQDGITVRHFILTAPKETIVSRLIRRGEEKGSWAEQQIDRCMKAFDTNISGERIDTTERTAEDVAMYILSRLFAAE